MTPRPRHGILIKTLISLLLLALCITTRSQTWTQTFEDVAKAGKALSKVVNVANIKATGALMKVGYDLLMGQLYGGPVTDQPQLTTSSSWSNENFAGHVNPEHVCTRDAYVTILRWKEQPGRGLVDLEMTCSDSKTYWFTNTSTGDWNMKMACISHGFSMGQAVEQGGYGLVNFHAKCLDGHDTMVSNGNPNGAFNGKRQCPPDAPVVIGAQTQEQPGYGVINFRLICGTKREADGQRKPADANDAQSQCGYDWHKHYTKNFGIDLAELAKNLRNHGHKSTNRLGYAYGDPKVCCVYNHQKGTFEEIDVWGPIVSVCVDEEGAATAIEFVEVCDKHGRQCQTDKAWYVAGVGRLELSSYTFKNKDMRSTIGGNNKVTFCDGDWSTVPVGKWQPSEESLTSFGKGRLFFSWRGKPYAAIEGPPASFLIGMFLEEGNNALGKIIQNATFSKEVGEMNRLALEVLALSSGDDPAMKQQREDLGRPLLMTSFVRGLRGNAIAV